MNVLERILELRREREWTEYTLAERSGLTQSTINSWFRNNTLPTIPSLEKIVAAFGMTMSEFFLDGEDSSTLTLTQQQIRLLKYASRLNPEQLEALMSFLERM